MLLHEPPRILIIGRRCSGKSTLGSLLVHEEPSWKSVATSDVTIDLFATRLGLSPEEIKAQKNCFRPALIALSDPLVAQDPGVFVRLALERGNIVNGIRHTAEFERVRGWFDLSVFVSRPRKEIVDNDNYNIPAELTATCDMKVSNIGDDLFGLHQAAKAIIALLRQTV